MSHVEERESSHLTDQVLVALRRIIRATDLHSRQLLKQFGITGPQLLALRAIDLGGELSSGAIARTLSVSLPTASDIVLRLEKRGLVVRCRNPVDRRQILVSLTDDGRRTLEAAPPALQEAFTGQLRTLEEWEQTQILAVLQRVVAMMEAEALDASPVLTSGELTPDGTGAARSERASTPAPADDLVETSSKGADGLGTE